MALFYDSINSSKSANDIGLEFSSFFVQAGNNLFEDTDVLNIDFLCSSKVAYPNVLELNFYSDSSLGICLFA